MLKVIEEEELWMRTVHGDDSSQDSFTVKTLDYYWELINETHNRRFQASESIYHFNLRR